jgi:hypothetical protein
MSSLPSMRPHPTGGRRLPPIGPNGWAAIGITVTVSSVLAFAALQYVMPETVTSGFGLNHAAVGHFADRLLGTTPPPMSRSSFTVLFRLFLTTAWLGYLIAVGAGLSGGSVPAGRLVPVIGILALILAVACPPSLSTDSYAYVGLARLQVVHGLNPYTHSLAELGPLGDPAARFNKVDIGSVYGPVWAHLSALLIFLLRGAGLWWQVVAMKVVGGAALMGTALAGRKIADHFEPDRGGLALLAIGLNPLFLIEGPGNAHNDLLMMALLLWGASLVLARNDLAGALLIGLSAGVKVPTVAVLPWIALDNAGITDRGRALRRAAAKTLLVLAPTVLGFVPLWEGTATFGPVLRRLHATSAASVSPRDTTSPESPHPGPGAIMTLARQGPVIVIYVGLTAWLLLRRRSGSGDWLDAWVILAFALIVWTMGVWFPWYLMWPWAVVLTRWDRTRMAACAACAGLAISALFKYSYVW